MDKRALTERDICTKFITPAISAAGQQAIGYGELLDVPFAFSSNGDGFLFRDSTGAGAEMALCDALEANLSHARTKSTHLAASVVHHLTAA